MRQAELKTTPLINELDRFITDLKIIAIMNFCDDLMEVFARRGLQIIRRFSFNYYGVLNNKGGWDAQVESL